MGEGLVDLARRFVACSEELERLRDQIKLSVLNGGAGDAARPTQPRSKPGSQSGHPNALKAAEVEGQIVELLHSTPGMKTGQIAKGTASKGSTTTQRLERLRSKGLIERDEANGWTASV